MKKRLLAILMMAVVTLSVTACGKTENTTAGTDDAESTPENVGEGTEDHDTEETSDISPLHIRFHETTDTWDKGYYVTVSYDVPELIDGDETSYSALADSLAAAGAKRAEKAETTKADLIEFATSDYEYASEEDMGRTYSSDELYSLTRADSVATSFCISISYYSYGAHGYMGYEGENYDSATGQELALWDVVSDMDAFVAFVQQRIKDQDEDYYNGIYDGADATIERVILDKDYPLEWFMTSESIVLCFNSYVLGDYALGPIYVTVYFEELPEAFVAKYIETPASYLYPVICAGGSGFLLDIDGDGAKELVSITSETDQEADTVIWRISAGDQSIDLSHDAFGGAPYIVHTHGKDYIIFLENYYNDLQTLYLVDIENVLSDGLDLKATFDGGTVSNAYVAHEDANENTGHYESYAYPLSDPGHLLLEERMDLIKTLDATKLYYINSDGELATEDSYYDIIGSHVVATKRQISGQKVDADGNALEKTDIAPGTYLYLARTDGATWVDLVVLDASQVEQTGSDEYLYYLLKSGEIISPQENYIRISIESNDGEYSVDGVSQYDIFEGSGYSG